MIFKMSRFFKFLRIFDIALFVYLIILSTLIIIFQKNLDNWYYFVTIHLIFIIASAFLIKISSGIRNRIVQFFRDWYLLFLFTFLYKEMHNFNFLIHPHWLDRKLMKIEYFVFRSQPSIWLAQHTNIVWHEILHFAYGSYYFMIPVLSAVLYFKKKKEAFYYMLTSASIAFFISYLMFALFPVQGPRYELVNEGAVRLPGWIFSNFVYFVQDTQAIRGGCMPSSHCAVALVVLVVALKYEKILGYILLPLVFLLCISTVYGRYHYGMDVIAGLAIGLFSLIISPRLIRWWNRKHSGS